MRMIILSLLVLVALSACNPAPDANQLPTLAVLANASPIPATQNPNTVINGDTATHTDAGIGFSFSYPAAWWNFDGYHPDAVGYAITLQSEAPTGGSGEGVPVGMTKVDIYIDKSSNTASLEALRIAMFASQESGAANILEEQRLRLDNGIEAYYLHFTSSFGDEVFSLLMVIKGYGVQVALYGDENYLWTIANSIVISD